MDPTTKAAKIIALKACRNELERLQHPRVGRARNWVAIYRVNQRISRLQFELGQYELTALGRDAAREEGDV